MTVAPDPTLAAADEGPVARGLRIILLVALVFGIAGTLAELLLLVLPETEEDLPILWRDFSWKVVRDSQAYYELLARSQPDNAVWHRQLAEITLRTGDAPASMSVRGTPPCVFVARPCSCSIHGSAASRSG